MKRFGVIGVFIALMMIAAGCAPEAPAGRTWTVRADTIEVVRQQNWNVMGDRPYMVQVGFRSKLGVKGSTKVTVTSQCSNGQLPAPDAAPAGTTITVPKGAADVVFDNVQNLDLVDVLGQTAPLEILGTLSFAMNRNVIPLFDGSCAMGDALTTLIAPTMRDALETLIASQPVPPTSDQLVDLIVSNLGSYIGGIGLMLGAQFEGIFSQPDGIVGIGVQVLIPTNGALTDLMNTAFGLAGFFLPQFQNGFVELDELPSSLAIRVGPLTNSAATFDFDGDAGHYRVRMAIND